MHVFTASDITSTNSLTSASRNHLESFAVIESDGVTAGTRFLGDYEMHVDYDQNGNITDLIRMSDYITGEDDMSLTVSDNGMDRFDYFYTSGTNRLDYVTDANDNEVVSDGSFPIDLGDIKSAAGLFRHVDTSFHVV